MGDPYNTLYIINEQKVNKKAILDFTDAFVNRFCLTCDDYSC